MCYVCVQQVHKSPEQVERSRLLQILRLGLSQLQNISVEDCVFENVTGPSLFKGVAGAKIQNVAIRNLTLVMGMPNDNRAEGRELWKSDGTSSGTSLVLDINPGSASSNPSHLTFFDMYVFKICAFLW